MATPTPTPRTATPASSTSNDDLPVKFSANAKVTGKLTSANIGDCVGEGHVEFIGNGLADPVGIAAIALFAGGLLGLLFNARPAMTWKEG